MSTIYRCEVKTTQGILATTIAAFLLSAGVVKAQLSIDNLANTYTIDFDTTVDGVNNGKWAGTGFQSTPNAGQLDSDAWAVTGWSDGALDFGGTRTSGDYARGSSSAVQSTGGFYAFTGGSIGAGVALGFQPGGSDFAPGTITFKIQNNSEFTIQQFTISYEIHVRNDQPRSNTLNFSDSADNTNYTARPTLDFASAQAAEAGAVFTVTTRTITLTNLSIVSGGFYYLRWSSADNGGTGSRDEFALDDIVLSNFQAGALPLYWDPSSVTPGIGGTGIWSAASLTWNPAVDGSGTAHASNPANPLVFGGTDGVTPAVVTIEGDVAADAGLQFETGGYTLESAVGGGSITLGGIPNVLVDEGVSATISAPIKGVAGLNKEGDGTLILSGANEFSGVVKIVGTLVGSDTSLGNAGNDVQLASGTFSPVYTASAFTLGAGRDLLGNGGIIIPVGGTFEALGNVNAGLTVSNGTASHADGGLLKLSGDVNTLNGLTLIDPTDIEALSGFTLAGDFIMQSEEKGVTVTGSVTMGGTSVRRFVVPNTPDAVDLLIDGSFSGGGGARIHKVGDGTMRMAGNNFGLAGGVRMGTAGVVTEAGGTIEIIDEFGLGSPATTLTFQFNDGTLIADSLTPLTGDNAIPLALSLGAGQLGPAVFGGAPMQFGAPTATHEIFVPNNLNYEHKMQLDTDVILPGTLGVNGSKTEALVLTGEGSLSIQGFAQFTQSSNRVFNIPIVVNGPTLELILPEGGGLTEATAIITVNEGQLQGSGTLQGVVIGDGNGLGDAILDPFDPSGVDPELGSFTVTTMSLGADAVIKLEINSDTLTSDKIVLTSSAPIALDLTANPVLQITDLGSTLLTPGTVITLFSNLGGGGVSGTFFNLPEGAPITVGVNTFFLTYAAGDSGADVALVPEPSTSTLALAALTGAFGLRRRRMH